MNNTKTTDIFNEIFALYFWHLATGNIHHNEHHQTLCTGNWHLAIMNSTKLKHSNLAQKSKKHVFPKNQKQFFKLPNTNENTKCFDTGVGAGLCAHVTGDGLLLACDRCSASARKWQVLGFFFHIDAGEFFHSWLPLFLFYLQTRICKAIKDHIDFAVMVNLCTNLSLYTSRLRLSALNTDDQLCYRISAFLMVINLQRVTWLQPFRWEPAAQKPTNIPIYVRHQHAEPRIDSHTNKNIMD